MNYNFNPLGPVISEMDVQNNMNQSNPFNDVTSRPRDQANTNLSEEDNNSPHSGDEGGGGELTAENRRERNREAARKCRQRKYVRMQQIQNEKSVLETKHNCLTEETLKLQNDLQRAIHSHALPMNKTQMEELDNRRYTIIREIGRAYHTGDFQQVWEHFGSECVMYGPQSTTRLIGKEALYTDYAITSYLYDIVSFKYNNIQGYPTGTPHFRCQWEFKGRVKACGEITSPEFAILLQSQIGREITFEGVTNISFAGDKIVYLHRSIDQCNFLRVLVEKIPT